MINRSVRRRVLIVDDSSVMRAMLCEMFTNQPGYVVAGMAKSAREAVQMEQDTRPDIMAIDLMMPYIDGSQLLSMLSDRPSLIKVILSTKDASSSKLEARLLELGASAFYDKREVAADPERFCKALSALPAGQNGQKHASTATMHGNVIDAAARFAKPADEVQRLDRLRRLGVMNTTSDYCLDILFRHVTAQTGFPIVSISLIGEDRVWVKSGNAETRMELPREESICAQAICNAKPTIISDLLASSATRGLRIVASAPYIRSYAGVPIVSSDGIKLGMICMVDMQPRQPTPAAMRSLIEAAALATMFIEEASEQTSYATA